MQNNHELSPEDEATIAAFLTTLAEGKVCPHCQQPIESKKQVGRCVYALPCYHRLYQGKLATTEKHGLKEHPFLKEQREREEYIEEARRQGMLPTPEQQE